MDHVYKMHDEYIHGLIHVAEIANNDNVIVMG